MKKDPFTLTVALDKTGYKATGELYLDDGETYAHERGELVWRQFTVAKVASADKKKKAFTIASTDLGARTVSESGGTGVVDSITLKSYNPKNAFAKEIAEVTVERIVVLGVESKPKSITLEKSGKAVDWTYVNGTSAKGKKGGVASVLTIKAPGVHIVNDWSLLVQL